MKEQHQQNSDPAKHIYMGVSLFHSSGLSKYPKKSIFNYLYDVANDLNTEFQKIRDTCKREFPDKELWPGYYERRYLEFLTLFEFLPDKKPLRVLELGCGIGYYSAFLSKFAAEVVATDLEVIDPATHSPGLQVTRDFLSQLGIQNVTVMHASAEDLPFEPDSFDLVFSSHVIEHVPDVEKAVSEIARVLKPGGYNFCVVPTTTDRIHAFPNYYLFLFQRGLLRLFRNLKRSDRDSSVPTENRPEKPGSPVSYFSHFPFPPPHGVLPHYLMELRKWTPGNWKKILLRDERMHYQEQRGLQSNVFFPFLGVISPKTAIKFYSLTRKMGNSLSGNFIVRRFAISTLIITRKNGQN